MSIISEEETSFNRTLDLGVKHLKKVVSGLKSSGGTQLSAKVTHSLTHLLTHSLTDSLTHRMHICCSQLWVSRLI